MDPYHFKHHLSTKETNHSMNEGCHHHYHYYPDHCSSCSSDETTDTCLTSDACRSLFNIPKSEATGYIMEDYLKCAPKRITKAFQTSLSHSSSNHVVPTDLCHHVCINRSSDQPVDLSGANSNSAQILEAFPSRSSSPISLPPSTPPPLSPTAPTEENLSSILRFLPKEDDELSQPSYSMPPHPPKKSKRHIQQPRLSYGERSISHSSSLPSQCKLDHHPGSLCPDLRCPVRCWRAPHSNSDASPPTLSSSILKRQMKESSLQSEKFSDAVKMHTSHTTAARQEQQNLDDCGRQARERLGLTNFIGEYVDASDPISLPGNGEEAHFPSVIRSTQGLGKQQPDNRQRRQDGQWISRQHRPFHPILPPAAPNCRCRRSVEQNSHVDDIHVFAVSSIPTYLVPPFETKGTDSGRKRSTAFLSTAKKEHRRSIPTSMPDSCPASHSTPNIVTSLLTGPLDKRFLSPPNSLPNNRKKMTGARPKCDPPFPAANTDKKRADALNNEHPFTNLSMKNGKILLLRKSSQELRLRRQIDSASTLISASTKSTVQQHQKREKRQIDSRISARVGAVAALSNKRLPLKAARALATCKGNQNTSGRDRDSLMCDNGSDCWKLATPISAPDRNSRKYCYDDLPSDDNTSGSCLPSQVKRSPLLTHRPTPLTPFAVFVPTGDEAQYRAKYVEDTEVMGEGGYGKVKKLYMRDGRREGKKDAAFAVKIVDLDLIRKERNEGDVVRMKQEMAMMKRLDHPNIIKTHEVYESKSKLWEVMEYCDGGTLFQRLVPSEDSGFDFQKSHEPGISCLPSSSVVQQKFFDGGETDLSIPRYQTTHTPILYCCERVKAKTLCNIFSALAYLHKRNIVHRDIKPENLLWSSNLPTAELKLLDFGLSNFNLGSPYDSSLKTRAGTPMYVSPEVIEGPPDRPYGAKCDCWSAGMVMHYLLLNCFPFKGKTERELLIAISQESIDWSAEKYGSISSRALDLLKSLLVKDPIQRFSAEDALRHPWLADVFLCSSSILAREDVTRPISEREGRQIIKGLCRLHAAPPLKKFALVVIAKYCDEKLIRRLREIFRHMDLSHSGSLSITDIESVLRRAVPNLDEEVPPEYFQSVLRGIASDQTGFIEYSEFLAATIDRRIALQDSHLEAAFSKLLRSSEAEERKCISLGDIEKLICDGRPGMRIDTKVLGGMLKEVVASRKAMNKENRHTRPDGSSVQTLDSRDSDTVNDSHIENEGCLSDGEFENLCLELDDFRLMIRNPYTNKIKLDYECTMRTELSPMCRSYSDFASAIQAIDSPTVDVAKDLTIDLQQSAEGDDGSVKRGSAGVSFCVGSHKLKGENRSSLQSPALLSKNNQLWSPGCRELPCATLLHRSTQIDDCSSCMIGKCTDISPALSFLRAELTSFKNSPLASNLGKSPRDLKHERFPLSRGMKSGISYELSRGRQSDTHSATVGLGTDTCDDRQPSERNHYQSVTASLSQDCGCTRRLRPPLAHPSAINDPVFHRPSEMEIVRISEDGPEEFLVREAINAKAHDQSHIIIKRGCGTGNAIGGDLELAVVHQSSLERQKSSSASSSESQASEEGRFFPWHAVRSDSTLDAAVIISQEIDEANNNCESYSPFVSPQIFDDENYGVRSTGQIQSPLASSPYEFSPFTKKCVSESSLYQSPCSINSRHRLSKTMMQVLGDSMGSLPCLDEIEEGVPVNLRSIPSTNLFKELQATGFTSSGISYCLSNNTSCLDSSSSLSCSQTGSSSVSSHFGGLTKHRNEGSKGLFSNNETLNNGVSAPEDFGRDFDMDSQVENAGGSILNLNSNHCMASKGSRICTGEPNDTGRITQPFRGFTFHREFECSSIVQGSVNGILADSKNVFVSHDDKTELRHSTDARGTTSGSTSLISSLDDCHTATLQESTLSPVHQSPIRVGKLHRSENSTIRKKMPDDQDFAPHRRSIDDGSSIGASLCLYKSPGILQASGICYGMTAAVSESIEPIKSPISSEHVAQACSPVPPVGMATLRKVEHFYNFGGNCFGSPPSWSKRKQYRASPIRARSGISIRSSSECVPAAKSDRNRGSEMVNGVKNPTNGDTMGNRADNHALDCNRAPIYSPAQSLFLGTKSTGKNIELGRQHALTLSCDVWSGARQVPSVGRSRHTQATTLTPLTAPLSRVHGSRGEVTDNRRAPTFRPSQLCVSIASESCVPSTTTLSPPLLPQRRREISNVSPTTRSLDIDFFKDVTVEENSNMRRKKSLASSSSSVRLLAESRPSSSPVTAPETIDIIRRKKRRTVVNQSIKKIPCVTPKWIIASQDSTAVHPPDANKATMAPPLSTSSTASTASTSSASLSPSSSIATTLSPVSSTQQEALNDINIFHFSRVERDEKGYKLVPQASADGKLLDFLAPPRANIRMEVDPDSHSGHDSYMILKDQTKMSQDTTKRCHDKKRLSNNGAPPTLGLLPFSRSRPLVNPLTCGSSANQPPTDLSCQGFVEGTRHTLRRQMSALSGRSPSPGQMLGFENPHNDSLQKRLVPRGSSIAQEQPPNRVIDHPRSSMAAETERVSREVMSVVDEKSVPVTEQRMCESTMIAEISQAEPSVASPDAIASMTDYLNSTEPQGLKWQRIPKKPIPSTNPLPSALSLVNSTPPTGPTAKARIRPKAMGQKDKITPLKPLFYPQGDEIESVLNLAAPIGFKRRARHLSVHGRDGTGQSVRLHRNSLEGRDKKCVADSQLHSKIAVNPDPFGLALSASSYDQNCTRRKHRGADQKVDVPTVGFEKATLTKASWERRNSCRSSKKRLPQKRSLSFEGREYNRESVPDSKHPKTESVLPPSRLSANRSTPK